MVVPDLGNPTFHGVLRGLSRAAGRDGYHVLIADSAESIADERILAVETRRRCDGIVLCAPRMPEADLQSLLRELKPVVLVNRDAASPGTPVVAADYRTALSELLDLLYGWPPGPGLPRRLAAERLERPPARGGAGLSR